MFKDETSQRISFGSNNRMYWLIENVRKRYILSVKIVADRYAFRQKRGYDFNQSPHYIFSLMFQYLRYILRHASTFLL